MITITCEGTKCDACGGIVDVGVHNHLNVRTDIPVRDKKGKPKGPGTWEKFTTCSSACSHKLVARYNPVTKEN